MVDPNCTNAEPLRVDVGQGRNEFETLDDGDALEVHYGSQGGQHVFVAARIENPDPDHEELELAFRLVLGRAADAGSTDDSDLFGGPSDSDDFVSSRKLVVQASNAPNQFDQAGLVLLVSTPWDATGEARLELKVRDSCGRSAEALHGVVVE